MLGLVTEQLARRGVEAAHDCMSKIAPMSPERGNEVANELIERFTKTSSLITLGTILALFVVSSFMIEYSISYVATTLAIVEDNNATSGKIALTGEEPDAPLEKKGLLEDVDGQEDLSALEIPFAPITRKLRTTFKHLKQTGGFRNLFRGLGHGAFYSMAMVVFTVLFRVLFAVLLGPSNLFGVWAAHALAAIAGCNLHAAWTHAMIADRTDKSISFMNTYLDKREARKLVLPTLRLRVAIGATQALFLTTLPRLSLERSSPKAAVAAGLLFPLLGAAVLLLGLVLPAYIALIRCEASLLPSTTTPIVPLDATFNGALVNAEEVAVERGVCAGRIRFRQFATFRGAFDLVDRVVYRRVLVRKMQFAALSVFVSAVFVVAFVTAGVQIAGGCEKVMEALMYARQILKEEMAAAGY